MSDKRGAAGRVLLMDRGNAGLKAALAVGGKIVERWRDAEVPELIEAASPDLVAFCSVVPSWTSMMMRESARVDRIRTMQVTSESSLPFELRVKNPLRTGTDRLCAACGAWAEGEREAVIVDAGTAVTVDLLDSTGFRGGCIFPGAGLLAASLAKGTAALPLVEPVSRAGEPPGEDTEEAIRKGLYWGLAGAVARIVEMTAAGREGLPVFLTGGAAPMLAPHLPGDVRVRPDLVLAGILHIALGG